MRLSIGLENNNDGRSIAWALDYPGCFAYGRDAAAAIVGMAPAMVKYQNWLADHSDQSWLAGLGDFDINLAEVFEDYSLDASYNQVAAGSAHAYGVEAWFRNDWKALSAEELERARLMLRWSRADLLKSVSDLRPEELERTFPDERWSIGGILKHVAGAEWWYLERLDLTDLKKSDLPSDPFSRLDMVRAEFEKIMPALCGLEKVVGKQGELWSPRKLIRRALWHELDHIGHIYRLLVTFFLE